MRQAVSTILALFLCAFSWNACANADTLTFDDIDASAGDVILDYLSPYHSYTFTNLSIYTSVPGFPGYNNGIVSSPNAAYTQGDALGTPTISTITSATSFDFDSAYLGSGWYNGLSATFIGLSGSTKLYSETVTVDTTGAQLFNFNFLGIDTLEIYSSVSVATTDPYGCGPSGCSQLTLDNVTLVPDLNPPPPPPPPSQVPEPTSFILTGLGGSGTLIARRFRQSR